MIQSGINGLPSSGESKDLKPIGSWTLPNQYDRHVTRGSYTFSIWGVTNSGVELGDTFGHDSKTINVP